MSSFATYNSNPINNPVDDIRFRVGDTDMRRPLLTDGECKACIAMFPDSPLLAAIQACRAIMAKVALKPDQTAGPVSVRFSSIITQMKSTIASLELQISLNEACPVFTGQSVAEKIRRDRTIVPPTFYKGMLQPRLNEGDPANIGAGYLTDGPFLGLPDPINR